MNQSDVKRTSICDLPTELLDMIGDGIENDVLAFHNAALVNRRFHQIFNPFLYKAAVAQNHHGPTVNAARAGNLASLKLAADHGADLDYIHCVPLTDDDVARMGVPFAPSPFARWGTLLHFAIMAGHEGVVSFLLTKGVNMEAPGRLYCGCDDRVDDLLPWKKGGVYDPRRWVDKDRMIWTPLHYSICQEKTHIAEILLSAGASPDCRVCRSIPNPSHPNLTNIYDVYREYETRPCHAQYALCGIGSYFGDSEHEITALHAAAASGNRLMATRLVREFGVDPNGDGMNELFHYAAASTGSSMVCHLLSLGADPGRWPMCNFVSSAAVSTAFRLQNAEAAVHLLQAGAPVWYGSFCRPHDRDHLYGTILSKVLDLWKQKEHDGRQIPHARGVDEEVKKAFILVAQQAINSVPKVISVDLLDHVLLDGFFIMLTQPAFDEGDFEEYMKLTGFSFEGKDQERDELRFDMLHLFRGWLPYRAWDSDEYVKVDWVPGLPFFSLGEVLELRRIVFSMRAIDERRQREQDARMREKYWWYYL
ncbi:hypothetical protein CkaCkLH20_11039 [Colletotrichum karsti]|uniref:Uncharacterized protein n=1 Tax=Colletotrichum karsti TaxID=1095194 RepID=A0A9P6HUN0_9PEZI|nr:uncharacterized protein CkaCkLH20_11039 [Colletotrichum karsti]KAF9871392.1 hypothetical protein CkaCkLH20_11039 [Colletotrichum karsti]